MPPSTSNTYLPPSRTYLPASSPSNQQPAYAAGTKGLGHYGGSPSGVFTSSPIGLPAPRYNSQFTNSRPLALTSQQYSSSVKEPFRPSAFLGSTILSSTPSYDYNSIDTSHSYIPPSNTYGTPPKTYLPPSSTYGVPSKPSSTYLPASPSATYLPSKPSSTYLPSSPSSTYGAPALDDSYSPPGSSYESSYDSNDVK